MNGRKAKRQRHLTVRYCDGCHRVLADEAAFAEHLQTHPGCRAVHDAAPSQRWRGSGMGRMGR
jgi:hypothetical protein